MGISLERGAARASGACLEDKPHPSGRLIRRGASSDKRGAEASTALSLAERVDPQESSHEEVIQASSKVERLPHEVLSRVSFHVGASFPLVSKTFNKAWKHHVKDLTPKVSDFDPSSAPSENGLYRKYPAHQSRIEHLKKTHDELKKEVRKDQWKEIVQKFPVIFSEAHFSELRRVVDQNRQDHASQVLRSALVDSMPGVDVPLDLVGFRFWIRDENNAHLFNGITRLSLISAKLKVVPSELQYLTQLEGLCLDNNQITEIPPEIGALTQLRDLILNNNQIKVIPPEIKNLSQLKNLILINNQIKVIPPEIKNLTELQLLDLTNNQIKVMPPELQYLTQLEGLCLDNNQITEILPEIGALTQLRALDLNNNQITEIPPEIKNLTQLQELGLNNNQIKVISPKIGALTQLKKLRLKDNQITEISSKIGALTGLIVLDLHNNQITEVPPEIYAMPEMSIFFHGKGVCPSLGSMVRLHKGSALIISAFAVVIISLSAILYSLD